MAEARLGSKENQVEVEWPGFVENLLWTTPKLSFKALQFLEQTFGSFAFNGHEERNGVYERRRVGRTIQRRCLPQGRFDRRCYRKLGEPIQGPDHIITRVPSVRPQGDDGD